MSSDEISPEDSASNISCLKENHSRPHSQLLRILSISSAGIKAEAGKAVLMEHMTALKRKHSLEDKEEELRKEKEQLALETELAAANAKLHALEINSKCCSNRMNSHFERNSAQRTSRLNPYAGHFVREKDDKNNATSESHPEAQAVTVGPKQTAVTQTDIRPVLSNTQAQMMQVVHVAQQTSCNDRIRSLHCWIRKI